MDKQEEEEKKVKQLNREIMFIFEKHTTPFGYASAALMSVMYFISEKYGKLTSREQKDSIGLF